MLFPGRTYYEVVEFHPLLLSSSSQQDENFFVQMFVWNVPCARRAPRDIAHSKRASKPPCCPGLFRSTLLEVVWRCQRETGGAAKEGAAKEGTVKGGAAELSSCCWSLGYDVYRWRTWCPVTGHLTWLHVKNKLRPQLDQRYGEIGRRFAKLYVGGKIVEKMEEMEEMVEMVAVVAVEEMVEMVVVVVPPSRRVPVLHRRIRQTEIKQRMEIKR